jgi:hypothetical protein
MEAKGQWQETYTSICPKQTMHQSHTEFGSPSMLQLPVDMENFPLCKTVVQTSKPQGPDVLSDSYEAWI